MNNLFLSTVMMLLLLFPYEAYSSDIHQRILSNGISKKTAKIIERISNKVSQLKTYDAEFNEVTARGIIVKVPEKSGREIVETLREKLKGLSENAYFYDDSYGYDKDEISIVPTRNDIEYLKIVRTDGANYDLSPEDILSKYKEWNEKYQLELFGAGRDWIEARVKAKGVNWKQFANEVAIFCPDVVLQGTGTVQALELEMRSTKTLYLWWD